MMKRLFFMVITVFLLFVPGAYAHTYLNSTNPADGATVTEDLQTIVLNFEGKIEESSIFKVVASDGSEMALDSITIDDSVLTGTLATPLPNDTYAVEWEIISEDGHPLSGSFSFTVNTSAGSETHKEEDTAADTTEKIASDVNSIVDTLKDETNSDADDEGSFWTLVIVIALIVIVLTIITIYSYKRLYIKKEKKE